MMLTEPVILNIKNVGLSNEQFYQLCQVNDQWRLEETAQGELIIMPPVGAISGNRESEFNADVVIWNRQTKLGKVFSSSTIFILPNGGKRSPDFAWISNERWDSLTLQEQEKFAPICPYFVIELRSRTDSLNQLQSKMQEYLNSGLKLGWLIDPQNQQVEIHRQNKSREIVLLPTTLSGENILPSFSLYLPLF
ncbi:MAG: Uma2 family endonuclease [Crocosphaera sp.]